MSKKPKVRIKTPFEGAYMFNLGGSTQTLDKIGEVIMGILNAPYVDQSVKLAALETIKATCRVEARVDNCTLDDVKLYCHITTPSSMVNGLARHLLI